MRPRRARAKGALASAGQELPKGVASETRRLRYSARMLVLRAACFELFLTTALVAVGCGDGSSPSSGGAAGASASAGAASATGGASSSGGANAAGTMNVTGGAHAAAGAGGLGASGAGGVSAGGATATAGAGGVAGSGGSGAGGSGAAGAGGSGGARGQCQPPTSYRNLFTEVLSKSAAEVDARVNDAFTQLFHGSASDQPIYYELGTDQAYLLDVVHNDVRSEGVSYGMMIAVQLDKHEEFDKLWQFAVKRMRQSSGFFAWQLNPQGDVISSGSAPDGEEYFATALLFASKRGGDGTGDLAYSTQGQDAARQDGQQRHVRQIVEAGAVRRQRRLHRRFLRVTRILRSLGLLRQQKSAILAERRQRGPGLLPENRRRDHRTCARSIRAQRRRAYRAR